MFPPSLASALSALLSPPARDAVGFPVDGKNARQASASQAPPLRFVPPERPPFRFGGRQHRRLQELQARLLGQREPCRVYALER